LTDIFLLHILFSFLGTAAKLCRFDFTGKTKKSQQFFKEKLVKGNQN